MAIVQSITSVLDDSGFKKAETAFAKVASSAEKAAAPLSKFAAMQDKAADAASKAQQKVNQASINLINAKAGEEKAAANVLAAEQKLSAARDKFGADSKEAAEAEKRLTSAKLQHEGATLKTQNAEQRLTDAQRDSERASKELADAQQKAASAVDKYEGEVKQAENATGDFSKKMGTLGKVAAGAAILGVAVLAKATFDYAKAAVKAAEESVQANNRIQAIATSMGFVGPQYAGAIERMDEYASALSMQIGVEDESIKKTQAMLLTFKTLGPTINQTGGLFDRATQAAYDMAAAGFGSADSAAKSLGKALQDPILGMTALRKQAVTFTPAQQEMIKSLVETGNVAAAQEIIMKAVETQVGNTAAATANASDKMAVTFGELQEKIGMALLPFFNELVDTLIPIVQDLEGPLSTIASAIGDTLGTVLKELAPLLPTMAKSFAALAGAIADILGSAISALIPVVTPLIELFADIATRIGPILGPVLGKIGELLGAILSAVMPLIEPLTTLIMDILEAAAPIVEVLVDALIILVEALTPVFAAVGNLIRPFGDLVKIFATAMLPAIKPLLPIITILAQLLGQYLTRQIGVVTTVIGYLVKAFATIAPFILDKVTIPGIRYFTQFAEGVLDIAESALGWIPGFGDKLAGAREALKDWADKTVPALESARDKIGKEGQKIGDELVKSGYQAMTDPASLAKAKDGGWKVGQELGEGVKKGLNNKGTAINNEAERIIRNAEAAARAEARSKSPSRLFAALGEDLAKGLVKGLVDKDKETKKNLVTIFKGWYSTALDQLKEARQDLIAERDAWTSSAESAITGALNFSSLAPKTITTEGKKVGEQFVSAVTGAIDLRNALPKFDEQGQLVGDTFIGSLRRQAADAAKFSADVQRLIQMGLNESSINQIISAGAQAGGQIAQELLAGGAGAIAETNQLIAATQSSADQLGSAAQAAFGTVGATTGQSFMDQLQAQANGATAFAQQVQTLIAMGLSPQAIQMVLSAGQDAGSQIAGELIAGGTTAISQTNALVDSVNAAAANVGIAGADAWYAAGIAEADANIQAFQDKWGPEGEGRKKVLKVIGNLAAAASKEGKIKLDIKPNKRKFIDAINAILKDLGVPKSDWLKVDDVAGSRQTGGPVFGNRSYLVGESGPEIFIPNVAGNIAPMGRSKTGDTINITVNAGIGADGAEIGRQVVDAIKKYERRNGPVWVAS